MKRWLLFTLFACLHVALSSFTAGNGSFDEKILLIRADAGGTVFIGRDTLAPDGIGRYVQERLFKSYLGTGKMHDRIVIQWIEDGVTETAKQSVINGIKEGMSRALTDICLQKHEKKYDALDTKKQEKLKKQFPVLFQEKFEQEPATSR